MNALYQSVTDTIIQALERGVVPWRKPWDATNPFPVNAISNRPYRGVNVFLLGLSPFTDHRWLTMKQANEKGGRIRKGEKASTAIFWKIWDTENPDQETGELRKLSVPLLRQYRVFNAEQCDGLELSPVHIAKEREHQRLERAELIVKGMQNPPSIQECGSSAWYNPSKDLVQIPALGEFQVSDLYYSTLFHELGHATGHESRLNRKGVMGHIRFGSGEYSQEELVAELTSAFCSATAGLNTSLIEDTASYIQGWLSVLKGDEKSLVIAAAQAQRAADRILATGASC